MSTSGSHTIDDAEIAKFSALASEWWDPRGAFAPLHRLNPVRLAYIRDTACAHFGRDPKSLSPLTDLTLLDIGCGGGLIAEPMVRLGASVTGIDANKTGIDAARHHATQVGLTIDYRHVTVEELVSEERTFDIVLNLEVVEHVTDVERFLSATAQLVRPGGITIAATLNRTPKAYLLAIVGAEYILGWVARGTHDWQRFVRPAELAQGLILGGVDLTQLIGVTFDPLRRQWRLNPRDLSVNYMALGVKQRDVAAVL